MPVKDHAEQEWSDLEWRGVDNKMRNNLGLSSCAMP